MATTESLKSLLSKRSVELEENMVESNLKVLLGSEEIKMDFREILKDKTPKYLESIINFVEGNRDLQRCHPRSIVESLKAAAALGLSLEETLGYGYIAPRKDRTSFVLGYKGYIQLALRTGQYKGINVVRIFEGQLVTWNPLTEELILDFDKKQSEVVIGYGGTFQLLNGFKKTVYWSKEAMESYREKCRNISLWQRDYDAMAMKTVVRNMLSKWGVLSDEMQKAYSQELREENEGIGILNKDRIDSLLQSKVSETEIFEEKLNFKEDIKNEKLSSSEKRPSEKKPFEKTRSDKRLSEKKRFEIEAPGQGDDINLKEPVHSRKLVSGERIVFDSQDKGEKSEIKA
jgi:recombination protein RecT